MSQEQLPDENAQVLERRTKLSELRLRAPTAFPNHFKRDTLISYLLKHYADKTKEALVNETTEFKIAGRLMLKRVMGKATKESNTASILLQRLSPT